MQEAVFICCPQMEPNSNSMMKTKLTLFVAALSSALFGVGCVAPVETASGILLPTKTVINKRQLEETGKRKLVPRETVTLPAATKPGSVSAGEKLAAIKNSFWAVNKHLDLGGSFYLYLSTEQMLAKLDGYLDTITAFADFAGEQLNEQERQQMAMAIDMGRTVYEQSGLRDISGFGASSFALKPGLNRNVVVLHHYAEKREGLLWKLLGAQAHEQEVLKLLPADTVFAFPTHSAHGHARHAKRAAGYPACYPCPGRP